MLVLTRKAEESVIVAGSIEIKILEIRGEHVSLGFRAPRTIAIYRKEVYEQMEDVNRQAVRRGPEMESAQEVLSAALRGLPARASAEGRRSQ
jgi:carbon storage regulator